MVLDRRVLLSDLRLCGAALDREAKVRRVLHSVVPQTLRGITRTNLLVSECYQLAVAGACSTKSDGLEHQRNHEGPKGWAIIYGRAY